MNSGLYTISRKRVGGGTQNSIRKVLKASQGISTGHEKKRRQVKVIGKNWKGVRWLSRYYSRYKLAPTPLFYLE